ncbi:MAG: acetate kinase [Chthoniobacterales bacterium]
MKILVLNAGSSSQKSCLYEFNPEALPSPSQPLWEAEIDWTHRRALAELKVTTAHGASLEESLKSESRSDATGHMLRTLWSGKTQTITQPNDIDIVGHRVVHGGREYGQSAFITPEVKAAIARLAELAPAHNPANLAGIVAIEQMLGAVRQVAVFDTAFHAQMPEIAAIYPGPYEWWEQEIRRYGFHGISHQYCAARAAEILDRDPKDLRLVTCHLGNGCSLAAIRGGRSVDTTMGFTPLEGLMMGSRSGSIDPGLLLHLLRQPDYSVDKLDRVLNQESGLEGISGISSDLREILAAMAQGNSRAQLAFDAYVHSLRSHIGAMLATLGGLDALAFTAGVGEHAAAVRAAACEAFAFLGLKLDPEKNAQSRLDWDIAAPDSTVRVLVIHAQEDWEIARECWKLTRH